MKEVRYFYVPDASSQNELPQEEATHALRVLRLATGDEIFLMDGAGTYHRAEVTLANNKHCMYRITDSMPQQKAWDGVIRLAIAPTKNIDRIEWLVEKATEIGFDCISFLDCKFSERHNIRTDRIEKIVVSAMKQSRKPFIPKVDEMIDFKAFIDGCSTGERFICHCYNEIERKDYMQELKRIEQGGNKDVTILVGPEGDFSIDEVKYAIDHGFVPVTLGDFRLRTETAGLVAVTMSQLLLRK